MRSPEIIAYEPSYQSQLEAFFREVWQQSRFPFDPEGAHSDLRNIPTQYQVNGGGFWLMCQSDQIVGTVAIRRLAADVAEVKRLNVTADHRGCGFGDRLFQHALAHATTIGYRTIRLDTVRDAGPALHLFQKYGFVEIPRYNDNPAADLFMELRHA